MSTRLSPRGICAVCPHPSASLPAVLPPPVRALTRTWQGRLFYSLLILPSLPSTLLPPHHVNAFSRRVYGLEEAGREAERSGRNLLQAKECTLVFVHVMLSDSCLNHPALPDSTCLPPFGGSSSSIEQRIRWAVNIAVLGVFTLARQYLGSRARTYVRAPTLRANRSFYELMQERFFRST